METPKLCLMLCCLSLASALEEETPSSQSIEDLIPQQQSSFSFHDSNLYRINWIDSPNKNNQSSPNNDLSNDKEVDEEVFISTANQEKYRCLIPNIEKPKSDFEFSKDVNLNPYQLLKPLFMRKICTYRVENYWTYEICHGNFIRQFHEEPGTKGNIQEFYLGTFDIDDYEKYEKQDEENWRGKKRPVVTVDDLSLPYIEFNMTDGTLCDLSNKKRLTRVLYVCLEEGKHELYSIKETSTCEYEVIVFSPLLCLSPEFKLVTATENEINCYPVGNSPTIPKGYHLNDIENELKTSKIKKGLKMYPESLFEGKISIDSSATSKNTPNQHTETNIHKTNPINPLIIAQFMSGEYCLIGGSGWWKYEFCYGKKVVQFHEEKNSKKVIKLGEWNLEEHIKWINDNPSKRPKVGKTPKQVSHFYVNGEQCDLTKKPRTVEVKLKCHNTPSHPESVSLYLLEPRACEYILGVESPIICSLISSVDENGLFRVSTEKASN